MKKTRNLLARDFHGFHGRHASAQGLDPAFADQASDGFLADLLRRLFRPALQFAYANQSDECQESGAGLGSHLPPESRRWAVPDPVPETRPRSSAGKLIRPFRSRRRAHLRRVLQVNGILYVSVPDNAWAVDARNGAVLWHYYWKTKGGTHIGNRGMGMYRDWLYFETPDDYLVSLDAKTGKERWHKEISDFNEQYFSTMAPIVIGNHLLVGTGDDLDAPGFLQSFDPETGELQWKWYSEPEKMGDPGSETWPNLDSMRHGGAGTGFQEATIPNCTSTILEQPTRPPLSPVRRAKATTSIPPASSR